MKTFNMLSVLLSVSVVNAHALPFKFTVKLCTFQK